MGLTILKSLQLIVFMYRHTSRPLILKLFVSMIFLVVLYHRSDAQVTFVLKPTAAVYATSGDTYSYQSHGNSSDPNSPTYSYTITSSSNDALGNSNSSSSLNYEITSSYVSLQGSGNASAINYLYPNNNENASAQCIFPVDFVAPANSEATLYYETSGTDATNESYSILEDISTQQVILQKPLGSSGSLYEYPLLAGHTYGYVVSLGVGAIDDGSLSGTASYGFNEELFISSVPEPSSLFSAGAIFVCGILVCRLRLRGA